MRKPKTREWIYRGKKLCVVLNWFGQYCGYVSYPARPLVEEDYEGLLTWVPVHGGITYAQKDEDGFTYGFDTGHLGDDHNPRWKNLDKVAAETERMADAIDLAIQFEPFYLDEETDVGRARVVQVYHDRLAAAGIDFELTDNFGAMVSVLCGQV